MTITELIERGHQKTGRKAEGKGIDLNLAVISCLQEICMEMRWHWRRKWATFTSVAGTATYDLMSSSNGDADDIEELISVFRIDSSDETVELNPISDTAEMVAAQHSTTQGDPGAYFLEPGTEATLHLSDIPDAAKTYRYFYWAVPSPALEDSSTAIPLMPAKWHYVLLQRLVAEIWALLPGEGVESPNFDRAMLQYGRQLDLMKRKSKFALKERRDFKSSDEAVRST